MTSAEVDDAEDPVIPLVTARQEERSLPVVRDAFGPVAGYGHHAGRRGREGNGGRKLRNVLAMHLPGPGRDLQAIDAVLRIRSDPGIPIQLLE